MRRWPFAARQMTEVATLATLPVAKPPTTAHEHGQSRGVSRTKLINRHGVRFSKFSVIGGFVLVAGVLVQSATVHTTGTTGSYVIQAVFSIELSYLLNRLVTWRDREVNGASLVKWNVQRIIMTAPNFLVYAGTLRYLHLDWLAANLGVTALFAVVNYALGDRWSFATTEAPPLRSGPGLSLDWMPSVSVVIPCKNNPSTIGATVESLLNQDYPSLAEVIVVGDVGDTTWAGISHIDDQRLIVVEHAKVPGTRDPNAKRHDGILKSSGEVIALADSDIVMDRDWLTKGIGMLRQQGSGLVAGGMRSIHDSFWGRFVDGNVIAAKTPRLPRPYQVTAVNFGRRGHKPPITANAIFFREMYEETELDSAWFYGYEDYEWFWRVVKAGHQVTFDGALTAAHHHRRSYRKLLQEYARSSEGCAHFIRQHPSCPLARKRLLQAVTLPLAALCALAGSVATITAGYGAYLGISAVAAYLVLAAREVAQTRRLEAIAYPAVGLFLAAAFAVNLTKNVIRPKSPEDAVTQTWEDCLPATEERAHHPRRWILGFGAVIAAALALRLYHLGSAPEWQLDEITYTSIAKNLITHGTLNVPLAYQQKWQPFLYHPPFYDLLLAQWDRVFGITIASARLLGVLVTGVTLAQLGRLLWKLHGPAAALFTLTAVAFDGWLIYVERVSYIENVELAVMLLALLAYERAVRVRTWPSYLLAGLLLGAAVTFNSDGGYLLIVVVVHWLFIRRDTRQHVTALVLALLVYAGYVLAVVEEYGGWWWYDTLVQLRRITGQQQSGGSLNSPGQFVHLLSNQYGIFLPSVAIASVAVALLVALAWKSLRSHSLQPFGSDLLVPAWAIGGLAVFGPATLHFSQYFVMVLLPLYCLLWTRFFPWAIAHTHRAPVLVGLVLAGAVIFGLGSAFLRLERDSNAFSEFETYAAKDIPRNDLVVAGTAGDPVAYVIKQPWCSPDTTLSSYCLKHAAYVVTWQTYLQSANPLHLQSMTELLRASTPVKEFHQFSGEIIVWKVNQAARARLSSVIGVDIGGDQDYSLQQAKAYGNRLIPYIKNTLHANAVGIVWDLCDPSFTSDEVTRCKQSLSVADVRQLIGQARAAHLRVQLRPIVRVGRARYWNSPRKSWEGHVKPRNQRAWFGALLAAEKPYAELLRSGDQLVAGTELAGVAHSPDWGTFLKASGLNCHGCSVSIALWGGDYKIGVQTSAVHNSGVDWYPPLSLPAYASQRKVTAAWEASLHSVPAALLHRTTLDEESILAVAGAYSNPANWNVGGQSDADVQVRYFIAACQTVKHYGMAGIYFYYIPLNDSPARPMQFPAFFVGNAGSKAIAECARILRAGEPAAPGGTATPVAQGYRGHRRQADAG